MTTDNDVKLDMLRRLVAELETHPTEIGWNMDDVAEGGPVQYTLTVVVDYPAHNRINEPLTD